MSRVDASPSCDPALPWAPAPMPPLRSGPPFLMLEAIEGEPALAARIVIAAGEGSQVAALADLLRASLEGASPWLPAVVGCGTSEHVAQASAAIWTEALGRLGTPRPGPMARQALEAALFPWPGLCVGISHEGGTRATIEALQAARSAGARLGLVTAGANSPAAALVDVCLCTGDLDLSWCHTTGYLAPIVAAAAVGAALTDEPLEAASIGGLVRSGMHRAGAASELAREIAATRMLVTTASGTDRIAARELTLKVEEASYVPTRYRDLETMLHGHIPAMDVGTSMMLILTDREGRAARCARARQLLAAVARVGVRSGAILSEDASGLLPDELTPAGRIVVPEVLGLPAPVASLLTTAVPLQLVAYHLALALGRNPDALRREFSPYRAAAEVAESTD